MHVTLPPSLQIDERKERLRFFGLAGFVGILLLLNVFGIFKTFFGIDTAAIITLIAGYRTFYTAISGLLDKRVTADLAIVVAVVAALLIGEYLAAAEAMFIMLIGEGLEGYAAVKTHTAIKRFVEQMPHEATVIRGGREMAVHAEELIPGDRIIVRAGERISADGLVAQGLSSIDESTITGESLPRDKQPGDEVFCGTLNGHGLLEIEVTRAGYDTTLSRVIRLVDEARQRKAPVEKLADRYARYFLPLLAVVAAATQYFTGDWLRTVAVLIVACPCALILATPAAMVAAIGGLARRGILVRGGSVLQRAASAEIVFFDKTGTITEGRFSIIKIIPVDGGEDTILATAAAAERGSDHTLARVIVEEARGHGLAVPESAEARIVPGRGAECRLDGEAIRAGSPAFLEEHGVSAPRHLLDEADSYGATPVLVAAGDRLLGAILLRDRLRAGVKEALDQMQRLGIAQTVMLTGDRRRAAEAIARDAGIAQVEAELLPDQKLARVRQAMAQKQVVAMVGDGVNDAPALAAADVGIAVSGASDISAEAADVFYMGRSLEKLPKFFEVSRQAVAIVWQNIIVFAGIVNVAAVGFAAYGQLGPVGAAITHQVASLLVMLNSLRLLRIEKPSRWRLWLRGTPIPEWSRRTRDALAGFNPSAAFHALIESRHRWGRPAAMALVALWILNGVYILAPQEVGVIERFGRKVTPFAEPGLHYKLPWPVETLTRVPARRVRVLEVGFRSDATAAGSEPPAYEWNVQHREGRYQRKPEESLMLTGDQNMVEVNAAVHYRIAQPDRFLFVHKDGEVTLRTAVESVLRDIVNTSTLDDLLTTERRAAQTAARQQLQQLLDRYTTGVEVVDVRLLDVHPSVEVVDAFREVAGAFEEKNRLINEAEGYRNEQVALARGNAEAAQLQASGYSVGRVNRSRGDARRYADFEQAARANPAITENRLYLETMEEVLAGRKKMILDPGRGRRHLLLMEEGSQLRVPDIRQMIQQPPPPPRPREEGE